MFGTSLYQFKQKLIDFKKTLAKNELEFLK
jgi:hypothetical protein